MSRPNKFATLVAVGMFVGTSPILAQTAAGNGTPDGMPPANEGVCDELQGGTPGLYGLCVAYCESQDLDGLDLDDPATHMKNLPNDKILQSYNNKKKAGDPDMPCIMTVSDCPCWTQAEIDQIFTRFGNHTDADYCVDLHADGHASVHVGEEGLYDGADGLMYFVKYAAVNYAATENGPVRACIYQDSDVLYGSDVGTYIYRTLNVTPATYEICRTQILDRAAAAGVLCESRP